MKRSSTRRGDAPGARVLPRSVLSLFITGLASIIFAVGHEGRTSADSVDTCVDYMHAIRRCYGESAAPSPVIARAGEDHERLRRRCAADKERLDKVCR